MEERIIEKAAVSFGDIVMEAFTQALQEKVSEEKIKQQEQKSKRSFFRRNKKH